MDRAAISRRQLLQISTAATLGFAAPALIGRAEAQVLPLRDGEILPTPNLDLKRGQYRRVAGLRPVRTGGVRLEVDPQLGRDAGKTVIHNYGHGGGGITLSFGCAAKVVDFVRPLIAPAANALQPRVAIIGSGIIGLTVAKELRDAFPQLRIRVLTKSRSIEDSVSFIAGGQFAPSGIAQEYGARAREVLCPIITQSYARLKRYTDSGEYPLYGVRFRKNYTLQAVEDLGLCALGALPAPKQGLLPFRNLRRPGFEYSAYLIEPPVMLRRLAHDLTAKKVPILWSHPIADRRALLALPETIIINCTGLGARELVGDTGLKGVKGQLAVFDNPQHLKYLFSGGCGNGQIGYMFARNDDIVVGGTYETSFANANPDPAVVERILKRMDTVFKGQPDSCM